MNALPKPKDLAYEEALLRKRLEFLKSLKVSLEQEDSVVAQTVEAYTSIIDGGWAVNQGIGRRVCGAVACPLEAPPAQPGRPCTSAVQISSRK